MKVMVFYRPNSEHERRVLEYLRDFTARTGKTLPTIDVDTSNGIDLCQKYDIVKYPTILALESDGQELQRWDGDMLPQFDEVSYYTQDQ